MNYSSTARLTTEDTSATVRTNKRKQTERNDLASGGRSSATAGATGQGGPRRNARPARLGRRGGLRGRGDSADRIRSGDAQTIHSHVPPGS